MCICLWEGEREMETDLIGRMKERENFLRIESGIREREREREKCYRKEKEKCVYETEREGERGEKEE